MTYGILPNGKQQFIDSNGKPLASGKVYYYIPSTTTFKNTYQNSAGTVLNTNPVVLDANGQCIAYGTGSYRQQVYDVYGNLIWDVQIDSPLTANISAYVTPLEFGAVGDGTTDDTAAMMAAFASGLPVDGLGKSYLVNNSSLNTVIDTTATGTIGYGAGTKWFLVTQSCSNMTLIGNISFGGGSDFFLPKGSTVNNITVTGLARFSSWYSTFNSLVLEGTSYFGGDFPPTSNFNGFYYNTFTSCNFNYAVVDERYGPVNLNTFTECRFTNFNIKYSGSSGWTVTDIQSFHMNTFIGCELFTDTGQGITAPDGHVYSMVMNTNTSSDGTNKIINLYNESPVNGIYGDCFVLDTIHLSGNSVTFGTPTGSNGRVPFAIGSGSLGYNNPLAGEGVVSSESRLIPFIYPGKEISYGDWSILGTTGLPASMSWSNITTTPYAYTDTSEPTGLGRCARFTTTASFATVDLISSAWINENNGTLTSFAVVYQVYGGNPQIQVTNSDGSTTLYGGASQTLLANGWVLAYGQSWGKVTFSSGSGFDIGISAFSISRGAAVMSPASNQPFGYPLVDLSGGTSVVGNQLTNTKYNSYNSSSTKTVSSGSTTNWFTINFSPYSGQIADVKVIAGFSSGTGGTRIGIRESLILANGSGTLTETNLTSNVGANMSITFSASGTTLTVQTTTSASVSETARIAIQVMGPGMTSSVITQLN